MLKTSYILYALTIITYSKGTTLTEYIKLKKTNPNHEKIKIIEGTKPGFSGAKVPYNLFELILGKKPVIVEAGASNGGDTYILSNLFKEGIIHSFEPIPKVFDILKKRVNLCNNVHIYQLALSHENNTKPFYVSDGDHGASSLLKPAAYFNKAYFHADIKHPITVKTITLDSWAQKHKIQPDFLWLDMEGNELNALKGALQTLQHVKAIYSEVNLNQFWVNCVRYKDLRSFLKSQNFAEVWTDIKNGWNGNVLFVKNNLLNK